MWKLTVLSKVLQSTACVWGVGVGGCKHVRMGVVFCSQCVRSLLTLILMVNL